MKKTARVIITSKCDRKCPGCCNSKLDYTSLAKVIGGITALKDYEEVVITGGEPMINPAQLYTVIKMLRKQNKRQKIYLYTACLTMDDHPVILKHLDGITVTVHAEATDEDIRNLKYMSSNLYDEDLDMRLRQLCPFRSLHHRCHRTTTAKPRPASPPQPKFSIFS